MSVLDRDAIGNCAVLTLNRPDSLNAITTEMLDLFERRLDVFDSHQVGAVQGRVDALCLGLRAQPSKGYTTSLRRRQRRRGKR